MLTTSSARLRVAAPGVPGHGEDERGRALGSRQRLGTAVPPGLARSRHSYWQAGRGPSGGAHGAACYWLSGLPLFGEGAA